MGIEDIDILYSEPEAYAKGEKTEFSKGAIEDVRFVDGFSRMIDRDSIKDLLVLGAGFDKKLLDEVVDSKGHARKIQVVGFLHFSPIYISNVALKLMVLSL